MGLTRRKVVKSALALLTLATSSMTRAADRSARLLSKIRGMVVHRGDRDYPLWRAGMSWYIFKPERYPDTIIQAKTESDVVETINYARENGQKLVVRSTGHNPVRAVLRDGGILLDLSRFRDLQIDPDDSSAWVQPGIRAEELLEETTHHGLAFPAAHTGIVGLGGYLLGGGIGWNIPEYGIACRSVLAAEVITADGQKIIASRDSHPDLLWALRGSGTGFFGAVLRYKLKLYPLHRKILLNRYVLSLEDMDRILEAFAAIDSKADPRLEMFIKIGRFYPFDKPYSERDLVFTVGFFAFGDSDEEAMELMSPVNNSPIPAMSIAKSENTPLSYADLYRPPETDYSSPNRIVVNNMWTNQLGQVLTVLSRKMQDDPPPSPRSFLLGGWSMLNTLEDPGACVQTGGKDYFSWYMIAEEENDIAECYRWMDESLDMTNEFSRGRYINEIDTVRYPHLVKECFAEKDWVKLAALRKKYDPGTVFHNFPGYERVKS